MPYYQLLPNQQMNFQVNRMLTYGEKAADLAEVREMVPRISDLETWYNEWEQLARRAESQGRRFHAAYYYRMAEFFLQDSRPEKTATYAKAMENFYPAITADNSFGFERFEVPYEGSWLPAIRLQTPGARGTIVIHGGYDSFIEEFYLGLRDLRGLGYTLILFEGPGQGKALKNGLKFTHEWEKPVKAVLDYFDLEDVILIGLSWGGYLCLRAAAFEPRIKSVAAYDILYDGLDLLTNNMPFPRRQVFRLLLRCRAEKILNRLVGRMRRLSLIIDWAITHGMYITGTRTPYEFFTKCAQHNLRGLTPRINQDVLLLAGEKDHYVPLGHYYRLRRELTNARSVRGRVFTVQEGGEQHCQVGNHHLATDEIVTWIKSLEASAANENHPNGEGMCE